MSCPFSMRFLLLCPVALLLLTAPAKTIATESDEVESIPTQSPPNNSTTTESSSGEPLDSSSSPATSAQTSSPSESVSPSTELAGEKTGDKPVLDQPDPEVVSKLSKEIAEAKADLKTLNEEQKILDAFIKTAQSKVSQMKSNREALAGELRTISGRLRKAKDELSAEGPQCESDESGLAKLIDEETKRRLVELKAKIEFFYKTKFEILLKELRLKIKKQMKFEASTPVPPFSKPIGFR